MIVIAAIVIGALTGGLKARRRGGKPLDILQYAAVHAIAFGLAGLFVTIVIDRMAR